MSPMRPLRARLETALCIPLGAAAIATLLSALEPANARPLHVRESFPKANAVFDGGNAQYIVRFDGLVDHGGSKIDITEGEKSSNHWSRRETVSPTFWPHRPLRFLRAGTSSVGV